MSWIGALPDLRLQCGLLAIGEGVPTYRLAAVRGIMGEKTADDVARELLFTTTSEREPHAVAVQALLAGNEALRTNDELIAEGLRTDREFCDEWRRTGPGRAVATALVRYRSDHDLAQRELADRLRMAHSEVARLELGEENPTADALRRLSDELGIEVATDVKPPGVE